MNGPGLGICPATIFWPQQRGRPAAPALSAISRFTGDRDVHVGTDDGFLGVRVDKEGREVPRAAKVFP